MTLKKLLLPIFLIASAVALAVTPGPGSHYATDAYPGFDNDENILPQERKTQSYFWWRRAKFNDPKEQLSYARALVEDKSYSSALTAYNALVAKWPISNEAILAQEELADTYLYKLNDPIVALEEYKYLVDFYSSSCDYDRVMSKMYETAKKMRENGKRIVFFKFANTADVRRAFEAVVLRAPGALFAPEAMYTIVQLRVLEEEYAEAIDVCKTIRNRYSNSTQAKDALYKEAELRMILLRAHEYNRDRCLNTLSFMDMASRSTKNADHQVQFLKWRAETAAIVEKSAYESVKFYDSITRKKRGTINAYEGFLRDYPASSYAQKVRERLAELKSQMYDKESK